MVPALKRPPLVKIEWGKNLPPIKAVIENLNVRYTQFLADGTPVRAVANLRLREANRVSVREECCTENCR